MPKTNHPLTYGTDICQCSACGEFFKRTRYFDMHRKGGVCVDPATLVSKSGERLLEIKRKGSYSYWGTTKGIPKDVYL